MPDVAIIMGSPIDQPVMAPALETLEAFGIEAEVIILSAHKTPHETLAFAEHAGDAGYKVLIAGAGGAAHLPGMLASVCDLPVIGVPIAITKLNGMDSLASMVQMPPGVPVATVAIDGARNAGLLAIRILAVDEPALAAQLKAHRIDARNATLGTEKRG